MYSYVEKIDFLKSKINEGLLPLISGPCIYLDLPYHSNIGDTLIWEGTEQFMASNHVKCLYRHSKHTSHYKKIPKGVTILLHGGGNFGDVWREHQELRLRVIKEYPNNPIIILPQTVYYSHQSTMQSDALAMACHTNLTICARDKVSYRTLQNFFSANRILMLPDMAFCIPQKRLNQYITTTKTNKTLLVKRTDKELSSFDTTSLKLDENKTDIRDWPSMENLPIYMRFFYKLYSVCHKIGTFTYPIADTYAQYIIRPNLVKAGIRFINPYKEIYTTRLHVAILATLLHKPFIFIDNSYGKNSSFYYTWLTDLKGSTFLEK
ncbi:polysaccharide pyruvyl transferase family protein [Bacteroides cellulosilyticus]|uniref:polysaccharide pyruvyl transferase family protein n=1 Tax=Bacteroides cellulosilyticus TaxID=246787 RepID=UPI0032BF36F0